VCHDKASKQHAMLHKKSRKRDNPVAAAAALRRAFINFSQSNAIQLRSAWTSKSLRLMFQSGTECHAAVPAAAAVGNAVEVEVKAQFHSQFRT